MTKFRYHVQMLVLCLILSAVQPYGAAFRCNVALIAALYHALMATFGKKD
jgi:hypothetical protein